ncbi:MAG: hypothetical protein C4327_14650 [Meiothermus sp.]
MRSIIALLALLSALSWAQPSKVDEKLKNRLAQGGTVEVIVEMEGPAFYREVLKAQLIADDSGSRTLSGPGGTYTLNSGDGLKNQYYPSAVQPIGGAEALLGWASAGAVSAQSISDNRPERVKEKGDLPHG